MNRIPIRSSSIISAGYDPETREMDIEFSSLAVYRYSDVTLGLWRAFMDSKSKGVFFATYIRVRDKYTCIRPRPTKEQSHGDSDKAKERKISETKQAVAKRAAKNRIS